MVFLYDTLPYANMYVASCMLFGFLIGLVAGWFIAYSTFKNKKSVTKEESET